VALALAWRRDSLREAGRLRKAELERRLTPDQPHRVPAGRCTLQGSEIQLSCRGAPTFACHPIVDLRIAIASPSLCASEDAPPLKDEGARKSAEECQKQRSPVGSPFSHSSYQALRCSQCRSRSARTFARLRGVPPPSRRFARQSLSVVLCSPRPQEASVSTAGYRH
jgi:hypothetical protein